MADNVQASEVRANPWRIAGWGIAVSLILLPFVAMQFTSEVNWTLFDFIFAIVLLGSVGLGLEFAIRRTRNFSYRGAAALAILASFLLIWINGAVGIIGNEQDDANLLYLVVVAIALFGSVIVRARAAAMARVMVVAAAGTVLVPVIGWIFQLAPAAAFTAPEVPISTIVFTGLWLLSAWLFRKAANA